MAQTPCRAPLLFSLLSVVALFGGSGAFADAIVLPPSRSPDDDLFHEARLRRRGSEPAGLLDGGGILRRGLHVRTGGWPVSRWTPSLPWTRAFVFHADPDITISLILMKKFFLNVSVLGDFANNSIQMGYKGGPDEVVRSVVLGTQGITIPGSPLMQIPDQPKGSLGAMAAVRFGQLNEQPAAPLGRGPAKDEDIHRQDTSWWSRRSASTRTCAAGTSSSPISGSTRTACRSSSRILPGRTCRPNHLPEIPARYLRRDSPGFHLWTGLPAERLQGKGAGLL